MDGRQAVSILVNSAAGFVKRRNSQTKPGNKTHAREGGRDKSPEAGLTASSLARPLHTQHGQGGELLVTAGGLIGLLVSGQALLGIVYDRHTWCWNGPPAEKAQARFCTQPHADRSADGGICAGG